MRLDGKAAIVTGAGSGIGQALALELAARGADLLLVGRRRDAIEETMSRAAVAGNGLIACLSADISRPDGRREIARAARQRLRRVDLLVNNAGSLIAKPFAETTDAEAEALLRVNLLAPMALARELLPDLAITRGRIVNVGSMFGEIAFPLFAAYSATKFGLRGASDALRRELKPAGIGVTHAAPRATRTGLTPAFAALVKPFGMKLDSPERVAARIADAIELDQDRVWPGPAERFFAIVQALAPAAVDRGIGKPFARWTAGQPAPLTDRETVTP